MTRTDIINLVAQKIEAKTYLEIGIFNPNRNFDYIMVENRIGVDPRGPAGRADIKVMTSDEFFAGNKDKFDLIFVDGDHRYPPGRRDVENALKCLAKGGAVIMHDCLPKSDDAVLPEKPNNGGAWNGEIWKVWRWVRSRHNLDSYVIDTDHGVGIIRRAKPHTPAIMDDDKYTWRNAKDWANIKEGVE